MKIRATKSKRGEKVTLTAQSDHDSDVLRALLRGMAGHDPEPPSDSDAPATPEDEG